MKTEPLVSGIHHGDCLRLLQQVPDKHVNLIVTDPPYLVNYQDRSGRKIANDQNSDWVEPTFRELYRVLKPGSFCVSNYGWNKLDVFMAAWRKAGFRPVGHFVWVKSYNSKVGMTKARHEMAYLLAKGRPSLPSEPPRDVLRWKYSGNKLHPTQKPVQSLEPLIKAYSQPGHIVLDPFMGSGSTAIAAWRHRRRFMGMELDADYYGKAKDRLRRYIAAVKHQVA